MTEIRNFDFGARKHAPKPKPADVEDVPFRLEADGPVYHMRGDIDQSRVSMMELLFTRARARGDDKSVADHTNEMLDMLFTPETADELLRRVADPDDYFEYGMFRELIEKAVSDQAGGRPTTSSRTSSRSRPKAGAKSTASSSSRKSTSGRSRSTAK